MTTLALLAARRYGEPKPGDLIYFAPFGGLPPYPQRGFKSYGHMLVARERSRGGYDRGYIVGGSGLGGTGIYADLAEEIGLIDNEMRGVESQLFAQIGDLDTPKTTFYRKAWEPFYLSWTGFRDKHTKLLARAVETLTPVFGYETYKQAQEYRSLLGTMVASAKIQGFTFTTPDPTPPKTNIFQDGYHAIEKPVADLWEILKIAVYCLIGLIVVGGLYLVKVR